MMNQEIIIVVFAVLVVVGGFLLRRLFTKGENALERLIRPGKAASEVNV